MTKPTFKQIDEIWKSLGYPKMETRNWGIIDDAIILAWQKAQDEILDELNIDKWRMFGVTNEAVKQLVDDDDITSILIEIFEELRNRKDNLNVETFTFPEGTKFSSTKDSKEKTQ
jgi:hypothetical protein